MFWGAVGRRKLPLLQVLQLALVAAAASQAPSPYSSSSSSFASIAPAPYISGSNSSRGGSSSPASTPLLAPSYTQGPGPAVSSSFAAAPSAAPGPSAGTCTLTYDQTLTANQPAPAGVGGQGIAVASDGSVALLSGSAPQRGAPAVAYLFSYYPNQGQYSGCPQAISDPAPLLGLNWGSAFALSGDASVVLVGASGRVLLGALTGQGQDKTINGQVYVYKLPSLPGATLGYAPTGSPLQPPNNQSPFFGDAGLYATEGAEYIYVASPVAPQPSSQLLNLYGNASVFVYSMSGNNGWSLSQTILPPRNVTTGDFGRKVVATPTGNLLVITDPLAVSGPESCGVFGAQPGYLTTGAVYIYTQQSGTQYQLAQTLQGNTSSVSGFGTDVALSADGSLLAVGAPEVGAGGRTVHIFSNNGSGQFVAIANISAPAESTPLARFGQLVALSGDGELLVVHAPLPYVRAYNQPSNAQSDAVYIFKLARNGSNSLTASQAGQLTCPNDQYDPTRLSCQDFEQLALSQDGRILLTSGGFAGAHSASATYVYGSKNCVGTAPPTLGA